MNLYIDGPEDGGEGRYVLVAETGEMLAGHYCSNVGFARFDLVDRRAGWREVLTERFGEYSILHVGDDAVTHDELVARAHALVGTDEQPAEADQP